MQNLVKELYKRSEVLKLLSISATTFHRLVNEGKLKDVKVGGATMVKRADIISFIDSLK